MTHLQQIDMSLDSHKNRFLAAMLKDHTVTSVVGKVSSFEKGLQR